MTCSTCATFDLYYSCPGFTVAHPAGSVFILSPPGPPLLVGRLPYDRSAGGFGALVGSYHLIRRRGSSAFLCERDHPERLSVFARTIGPACHSSLVRLFWASSARCFPALEREWSFPRSPGQRYTSFSLVAFSGQRRRARRAPLIRHLPHWVCQRRLRRRWVGELTMWLGLLLTFLERSLCGRVCHTGQASIARSCHRSLHIRLRHLIPRS